jgi:hypothetical protein
MSVSNRTGFEQQQRIGSVPEQSKKPTCCVLQRQTLTCTHQPVGYAGFGYTCVFKSPVPHFGFFYLWLYLDILLQIAK